MPLSRLENFLKNTDGNILYVNPSDLDATDSVENQGNSLTRPFKTIQRALLEAARFSYNIGKNNDKFDKTTILVYPGTHYIDNRPGLIVANAGTTFLKIDPNVSATADPSLTGESLPELSNSSNFDIFNENNDLYKYNSIEGGVILPRGTSIIGMDLRKTKIRPLFVPDPENSFINRTSIFRVTGGCYFYQFTFFDGDINGTVYKNYRVDKYTPGYSHHKLTAFEYADGANPVSRISVASTTSSLTDLEMYYVKIQKAYGDSSGRAIGDYPSTTDNETINQEFKIVGSVTSSDIGITSVTAISNLATIDTSTPHNLAVNDSFRVSGISSDLYNGQFSVVGISSATRLSYFLPSVPVNLAPSLSGNPILVIEPDTVNGASPYIFNCSIRSTFGMNGLHADGSKVAGFKSVVVAQFTGIGLQRDDNAFVLYDRSTGTYKTENEITDASLKPLHLNPNAIYKPSYENYHIKASNDSFIQDVSVFAIGYANQFLSESGGDQSITNSNSNFGSRSLVSRGFKSEAFQKDDVGYITHIIPPKEAHPEHKAISWLSLNVGLTTNPVGAARTERLYLNGYDDIDVTPPSIIAGYRVGSKLDEKLNLYIGETLYSSPILMPVPSNGDGPSSEKSFTVARTNGANAIAANVIDLTESHNFINGESVRVLSDDGNIPDGIDGSDELYYVITNTADGSLSSRQIKLARTFNDATVGTPTATTIYNTKGGILKIVSRVTDKVPGDLGHPIQFDTTNSNWYAVGSASTSKNTIYRGVIDNSSILSEQTGKTFIERYQDIRSSEDLTYRFRYVIPKEFTFAKEPLVSYAIQESSTVGVSSALEFVTVGDVRKQRNVRVIANATYNANVITFTTEKPHNLNVSDSVLIKNVKSDDNVVGTANSAYNGTYNIVTTPSSKTFTVTTARSPGSFINNTSTRDQNLPTVSRNKYKNTYSIYEIDKIQDHVPGEKDGIYTLTCLLGSVSPNTTDGTFNSEKFSQNVGNLYPTIDKDNYVSEFPQAVSFANQKTIGNVLVDNVQNSITKESTLKYYQDNRIGFAVTFAVSNSSGVSTVFTNIEHNLNGVLSLSIVNGGGGWSGISTTIYNVPLVGTGITGEGATVNIQVSAAGTVTAVEIVDGGSAYGVGNTMRVGFGSTAIVQVTTINNNIGDVIEIVGVGTTANRFNSNYNGIYRITGISSSRSVTYSITNNNNTAVNPGIYTTVNNYNGLFVLSGKSVGVQTVGYASSSVGIVTVTTQTPHALLPGNKFRLVGAAQTVYNGVFTVRERIGINTFTFSIGAGVSNPNFTTNSEVFILKSTINSQEYDSFVNFERIGNRFSNFYAGLTTSISNTLTGSASTIKFTSLTGISTGDYFQINNEIIRISGNFNYSTNVATVLRGVLGTKAESYSSGELLKKIRVIPTELRRFSSIRAANHTFEYVGFGHGNYSVALPQRQTRTLNKQEQLIAQSKQSDGGAVVYTGMNDSGDFYLGNKRISSVNGKEETINAAVQNYLGKEVSSLSVSFDDLAVRNSLTVDGGTGNLQTSEFKGPVNFANKVTVTSDDGLEVETISLKGNIAQPRLLTERSSLPTYVPSNPGDIAFNSNPTDGGFLGWVSVGADSNSWRRFGLVSRSASSNYITVDRIGINTFGTLRSLPNSPGSPQAVLDIRGGAVLDELRVIGNVDFANGATFASLAFATLYSTGISTFLGSVRVLGTTDSTNTVTGIVTVAGGVGISRNLNVGAGLSVSGISTFAGITTVTGPTLFTKQLNVSGLSTFNDLYVAGISTFIGTVTFAAGTINLGDSDTDNVIFNADVNSDILPNTDDAYDIGSAAVSKRWRHASFAGIITCTDLNSTSDINLKENIKQIDDPLSKVLQINGVTFNWKNTQEESVGVIAQEVEKVLPQLVKETEGKKSLNYNGLIGLLVEAIKEQQNQIDELKSKLG
jgi:hypothetical protein